jgi:hypothetical protein
VASPKVWDHRSREAKREGKDVLGIYELETDTLKVACVVGEWKGKEWTGKPRPKAIDPKESDVVLELKRVRPGNECPDLSPDGDTRVRLDVRFTETSTVGTRELETRSVSSTLTQSQKKSFSNGGSVELEAASKFSQEFGQEFTVGAQAGGAGSGASFEVKTSYKYGMEVSSSGKWTTNYSEQSERATEEAYQESLSTDRERSEGRPSSGR